MQSLSKNFAYERQVLAMQSFRRTQFFREKAKSFPHVFLQEKTVFFRSQTLSEKGRRFSEARLSAENKKPGRFSTAAEITRLCTFFLLFALLIYIGQKSHQLILIYIFSSRILSIDFAPPPCLTSKRLKLQNSGFLQRLTAKNCRKTSRMISANCARPYNLVRYCFLLASSSEL